MRVTLKNPPPDVLAYLQGFAVNQIIHYINMPPSTQAWVYENSFYLTQPGLRLWSVNSYWKVLNPETGIIRTLSKTRKKVTCKAPSKPRRKQLTDIERACVFLVAYLTEKNGIPPPWGFRAEQVNNLKAGYFDPEYWVKCEELYSATLEDSPLSGTFAGIRNYTYPDPNNKPSTPTYGAGIPSSGDPTYTGFTTGDTYRDANLRWVRKVYRLANDIARGVEEPLFLKLSGTITAAASTRPSRAMISAVIKRWIVSATSTRPTTTEPPIDNVIQAFWRYKTPRGVAPYFELTKPLRLMYFMRSNKYEEIGAVLTKAVVLMAPMPMMGKRFNNNTSVTSSISATMELWQVNKQLPASIVGYAKNTSAQDRAFRWVAGLMTDIGTLGGTDSRALEVSANGSIVMGWAYNASNNLRAFRWEAAVMTDLGTLGGLESSASAMTADGAIIIGWARTTFNSQHAFRWTSAGMVDLESPYGNDSDAIAMSADGAVVVGYAIGNWNDERAFRWENGVMTDLGTLGGQGSMALDVSTDGSIVVGSAATVDEVQHAFRWTSAGMVDLGTLGGSMSVATKISADGLSIIGFAYDINEVNKPCRWTNAGITDLGSLGGSGGDATAVSANSFVIVGWSFNGSNQQRAFRWEADVMTDLGTLGGTDSFALGVSADGLIVVGWANDASNQPHAFRWESGVMTDLGTLGGTVSTANALNTAWPQ